MSVRDTMLTPPLPTLRPVPRPSQAVRPSTWRLFAGLILLATVALAALFEGLQIRHDIWSQTEGVHFEGDISSGWQWGRMANERGLFHFYDSIDDGMNAGRGRRNDYPPLRLTIMTLWQGWTARHYPGAGSWRDDYDFTAPLLHTNTAFELAAAALTFLIIRHWRVREAGGRRNTSYFRGWTTGMTGALICWFNPAVIWNGHAWPQWDAWLVPFFLGAVLAASEEWWFTAGMLVGMGAFLKGQMLLGAPVLILWPMFTGRFGAVARGLAGVTMAAMLIALPWMLPTNAALIWLGQVAAAIMLMLPFVCRIQFLPAWISVPMAVAAVAVSYPWFGDAGGTMLYRLAAPAVVLGLGLSRWWRPGRGTTTAVIVAGAIFLTIPLYNSNTSWFSQGFEYGTQKFERMVSGTGALNIPAMLRTYINWPQNYLDAVPLPHTEATMPFESAARLAYGIMLVVCGAAAAIQAHRNSARILPALAAPWLLFYLCLTQMHGRYPYWAAAMAGLIAGVGPGMAVLAVIVSWTGAMGLIENQMAFERNWAPQTFSAFARMTPHVGWVLVMAAGVYLASAFSCKSVLRRGQPQMNNGSSTPPLRSLKR